MKRKILAGVLGAALCAGLPLALHAANAPARTEAPTAAQLAATPELRITRYPIAMIIDGQKVYRAQCASCHGAEYRGGPGGPDLTSSIPLYDDTDGKQLGAFLRGPHTGVGVSVASVTDTEMTDLANYLHAGIAAIADRGYLGNSILVGDAAAGKAYFNGAGGCKACHSATGDLAGIGGRLDPLTLQARILFPSRAPAQAAATPAAGRGGAAPAVGEVVVAADPAAARGGGGRGGGRGGAAAANGPVAIAKNAVRATVTAPGQASVTGQLVRLSPFDVIIADLTTGERKTWPITNGQPKVTLTDPLQGHETVRRKITDTDMHNLTAYLASLK